MTPAAIVVLDETDSTNAEARRRAEHGVLGQWITARRQTAGRGRSGRGWETGAGNLAASIVLDPAGSLSESATLAFDAGLAAAETVEHYVPGHRVELKWPNDVLLDGRKCAGILLEAWGSSAARRITVGIGINLATHPDPAATRLPPVSIAAITDEAPRLEEAASLLADAFSRRLGARAKSGFAAVREDWLNRAAWRGSEIEVRLPRETLKGVFEDLDPDGQLVLRMAEGTRRIAAGDVFPLGA